MKKVFIIIGTILLLALLFIFLRSSILSKIGSDFGLPSSNTPSATVTPYPIVISEKEEANSVFVPYWSLNSQLANEQGRLIYFGITPTTSGIDRSESGYQNLSQFVSYASQNEKLLTVRMLNQELNFEILEDPNIQEQVILDSIVIAKENGFDGIVLDLELKALPFDSILTQINEFVTRFNRETEENDLIFSVLVYGDTFYRVRPFDVKHIAENSDEVMIMAYDFHKSGGNPGPNFPKNGSEKYGYDYLELMDDFLASVPREKLTVVFGLFGYDWPVNDENISIDSGESLSYFQIQSRYVNSCPGVSCILTRDELSSETNITYTDTDSQKHSVWFEDVESVEAKKKLLKTRGINSFSSWAYSYY